MFYKFTGLFSCAMRRPVPPFDNDLAPVPIFLISIRTRTSETVEHPVKPQQSAL
jgi:hypothetical protein